MDHSGILAVLNDLAEGCDPSAYEDWYQRDHLPDRLGVPGFRHARRYRRVEGAGQAFFTFYEVGSPAVLRSAAYLARLAAPTAGTVDMMRHFHAMCRSVCAVAADEGVGIGGVAAVIGMEAALVAPGARGVLAGLLGHGAISRARLWVAAEDVDANPEAGLRPGQDARLGTILVVEGTEAAVLRNAAQAAASALGIRGAVGLYGLLHARDASA